MAYRFVHHLVVNAAVLAVVAAFGFLSKPALAQPTGFGPSFQIGDVPLLSAENERGMVEAIAYQRQVVAAGGWPLIPGTGLRPNDNSAAVAVLRQRLQISGDLARGPLGTFYDADVRNAVIRFQVRHGIRPTGAVTGLTLAHMNVSAADRLAQLEANLDRLREMLPKARGRYVAMNAPAFELQGVDNGKVEFVSRVISGKREAPTPVVSAVVQNVDLLPFWHVPDSIAVRDLIPTVRKDPNYLTSKKIRVYSSFGGGEVDPTTVNWAGDEARRYTFRQDYGPWNALGLVRLDMPNKFIVYMHDTPMKDLFAQDERAFSAGCIRVQEIFPLASWILSGESGWSIERLQQAASSGQKQTIRIGRPVPVYFVYLTAWVSEGVLNYRNDLYNRDRAAPMAAPTDRVAAAPFQILAP